MKAWPFTVYIAIFFITYGGSSLISEAPFFVGTDIRKLKQIESVYMKLGPNLTGLIFISIGLFLIYLAMKEYKEKDWALLTTMLLVKVIFVLIIIGYFLL